MSKNTELTNDVLKIIQEKRMKRNVMVKTVIISKDNDMKIMEIVVERKRRDS